MSQYSKLTEAGQATARKTLLRNTRVLYGDAEDILLEIEDEFATNLSKSPPLTGCIAFCDSILGGGIVNFMSLVKPCSLQGTGEFQHEAMKRAVASTDKARTQVNHGCSERSGCGSFFVADTNVHSEKIYSGVGYAGSETSSLQDIFCIELLRLTNMITKYQIRVIMDQDSYLKNAWTQFTRRE